MAAVKSFSTAAGSDGVIVGENVEAADDKSCVDETPDNIVGASVDETGDESPSVDESAVLENAVGNANDFFCDCRCANKSVGATENKVAAEVNVDALNELPFAPPLLHGSLADHGSMPLEFIEVSKFSASSIFLVLRLSSSDSLDGREPNCNDVASGSLDARPPPALSDSSRLDPSEFNRLSHGSTIRSLI